MTIPHFSFPPLKKALPGRQGNYPKADRRARPVAGLSEHTLPVSQYWLKDDFL